MSSAYVVHTLEAALWAFYRSRDFDEGLQMAANLGGDADAVASVYGQLAGAFYGIDGIDRQLVKHITLKETIGTYAVKLFELARVPSEIIYGCKGRC